VRPKVVRFVNFRDTLLVAGTLGSGVRLTQRSPITGLVTHVLFHYPPGTMARVRIRVLHDQRPIWPLYNQWIALDSATPLWQFKEGEPVQKDDRLEVEMENTDTVWTHEITVALTLEGFE
jgi:hypothetical protein